MALYIPQSIFHLARVLYARPENVGPYYVGSSIHLAEFFLDFRTLRKILGFLIREDRTDRLSRNVRKDLPLQTA